MHQQAPLHQQAVLQPQVPATVGRARLHDLSEPSHASFLSTTCNASLTPEQNPKEAHPWAAPAWAAAAWACPGAACQVPSPGAAACLAPACLGTQAWAVRRMGAAAVGQGECSSSSLWEAHSQGGPPRAQGKVQAWGHPCLGPATRNSRGSQGAECLAQSSGVVSRQRWQQALQGALTAAGAGLGAPPPVADPGAAAC